MVTETIGCYVITWENGVCGSGQHGYGDDTCQLTGTGAASAPGIISIVNTCSGGSGGTNTGIPPYPNPDSPGGNTVGYGTLPYSDDSDMMLVKYQQFSNIFHINSYGFTSGLRTKLFYLYLYQYEDQYTVSKLLMHFGTKPDILNNAVDMFTENASLSWDEFYSQFLTNPCEKIKAIGKHSTTRSLFENLKTKTNSTREFGEVLETSGAQINNYHVEGTDHEPGINLNISGGQIDGFIHSHYTGLLSVFSPGDLASISYLYKNNIIRDINTFVLGVVTASGTQYIMVIDNPNTFNTFAEQFLKNGEISENFTRVWGKWNYDFYNIKEDGLADENELGFVKLLLDRKSGLKILKGSNNSNNWKELSLENGQIVSKPCN